MRILQRIPGKSGPSLNLRNNLAKSIGITAHSTYWLQTGHFFCGFSKQAAPGLTPPRKCTHSDVSITNCLSINFQHLLIPRDQTTSLSGNSVLDKLCPTPGLTQKLCWASLMVQWLRIHLQMWGTQIRALVWEDPTCPGAAKSICANFRIPGRAPRHQRKFGWGLRGEGPSCSSILLQPRYLGSLCVCVFLNLFIFGCTGSPLLHKFFFRCRERGSTLTAACRFFIVVAFLVAEHGLQ